MLIWSMAWRNVWRNKRRTLITASALALGVMVMSIMMGLTDGMVDRMVRIATVSRIGEAQIHAKNYRETKEETLVLTDLGTLLAQARSTPKIKSAAPRVRGMGILAIADRSRGVQLLGVDPGAETQVTNWKERIIKGAYLDGPAQVMLGAELAEKLDVELGTKMVITAANVRTGEATTELVRVKALLHTGDTALDRTTAIIPLPMAQKMLGLPDAAHEIARRVDVPQRDEAAITEVLRGLEAPERDVVAWHKINKVIAQMSEMMDVWMDAIVYFLFLIIAFGVVNTISMSLLERMREFGVMRALGTSGRTLAGLIVAEALWLGLIGALPGVALGLLASWWFATQGFDFTGTTAYGMTFSEPIYGKVNVWGTLRTALIFTFLTALTSFVSAVRASRVDPVEAMRG